jgi:hypothetical protein
VARRTIGGVVETSPRSPVVWTLAASLLLYAAIAATRHWWPSTITAPMVAGLLGWRHPRARFAAYIFFSVLAVRGVVSGVWALTAYAVIAVALMQTPGARRAWPPLVPGRRPGRDDRMRRS